MEKISLAEALEKTGLKKKHIADKLGMTPQYYSVFVRRNTINRAQAFVIEKLTELSIEDIDVEVR